MTVTKLFSFRLYFRRPVGIMPWLGFSSGLPLALTAGTLQAWLVMAGMDIELIGLFTLAGLPYALKFLWAPLLDRYTPAWLGRRRGWMLLSQIALMAALATMGLLSPQQTPWLLGALALLVALLSASQDIVTDAYRADVLQPFERGGGVAAFVMGYRIAMLVSGALALMLSDHIGWQLTYLSMAALMAVGIVATLLSPEPDEPGEIPATLSDAIWQPLHELAGRRAIAALLALVVLYKLGDAFAGSLNIAFLIGGLGFSATEVGAIAKMAGIAATLIGLLIGGSLMAGLGLYRSLLLFGMLQAVTNLLFMLLAGVGKHYALMASVIVLENLAGGMGTAAFVALLMALCNHRFTATQYALLSAIAAIGRIVVGPASGYLVAATGWGAFFFVTFLVSLPGLWLLWRLRERIDAMDGR